MYRIFILEDDMKLAEIMGENLQKYNYTYHICEDFSSVLEEMNRYDPHLVLLDINLPMYDGFYWCSQIRNVSNIPIIFISSRDSKMDQIMALNMGGDDFIQKPFSMEILLSKINSLLRRSYSYSDNSLSIIEIEGKILDLNKHKLIVNDIEVPLTNNEFEMLYLLFSNPSTPVKRETIIKRLWHEESFVDDNTLTVNINRLRKKLKEYGIEDFIQTVKGIGYEIS